MKVVTRHYESSNISTMDETTRSAATQSAAPEMPAVAGFAHEFIDTPGVRTHVASIGEGDPVVLLHGFPQHWWQWHSVAPAIAEHGYRAICPDLRGAGWTEADAPRIERETRMRDLVAVLDALGVERAHLVCHDMGAITGIQLSYAHPERVRTMVQLSVPPGFMAFSPRLIPAFSHLPRLLVHRPDRSLRWLFTPEYASQPMSDGTVAAYLDVQRRPEIGRAVRALYRGMVVPEALRLVGGTYKRMRLRPPTLVAFGRHDSPFTEPTVRRICRGSDSSADRFDLAFVEDAAHYITDDAPTAVAELALDWFEREG